MRYFIILIASLITAPAYSQRVFRASSIDVAQDAKDAEHDAAIEQLKSNDDRILSAVESFADRLEALESSVAAVTTPVPDPLPDAKPTEQPAEPAVPQQPVSVRPSPQPQGSYIVKETLPGCAPCVAWDRGPRSAIEAVGWTVIDEPMTDPNGRAPRFRVYFKGGDREYRHQGSLTFDDLWEMREKATGRDNPHRVEVPQIVRQPVSQRYSTAELRAAIHAYRPGGWQGVVYAGVGRNTSVYSHLTNDHGFSASQVNGLSHDEAMILHDNVHGPVNQRISPVRRDNLVSLPVASQQNVGCAFGGCAAQMNVNYSNNSNGWYLGKNLGR